jgi:hypothetical protein
MSVNVRPNSAATATASGAVLGGSGPQLPVQPLINPLSSEDEAALHQVIERCSVVHDLIQRLKEVGIDVSQHEARNGMHRHVASTMKRLFFPDTLTPPLSHEPE